MNMDIAAGQASAQGPRQRNEDFAAVQRPAPGEEALGWIAALADGVSGDAPVAGGGRMAAQTTVLALMRDWHGIPADWDTPAALERLIGAQNLWLAAHNRRNAQAALTTLSAVVLRGQGFTLAQVGDSRIWLVRDRAILQLTQDHALPQRDFARLTRAVGLEDSLHVDFLQGELRIGDRLLLTSDGVHGVLDARRLRDLTMGDDPQAAAEALVAAALAAGTHDNATVLVLQVRGLAAAGFDDVRAAAERLPTPGELAIGNTLDGMTLTARIADNGVNRLFQARTAEGGLVALKMLCPPRAADAAERAMLAHEGWLGQRLAGVEGFVTAHPLDPDASHFYLRFDWHAGRTMTQMLAKDARPALPDFIEAARQLATALGRLHRLGVIHRDIKPANLHRGDDGRWRILDLGVALSGREPAAQRELHAGTPSYINPEQWDDPPQLADAGSDLFALGVSLYQWLTGHLPYGEIEPWQRARYRRDPRAPSRLDARVPLWLDRLLLKAVALDPKLRFETAEELLLAIERGAARPLAPQAATPLAQRDPLALWQIGLAMSVLLNALLIVWLLFLPR